MCQHLVMKTLSTGTVRIPLQPKHTSCCQHVHYITPVPQHAGFHTGAVIGLSVATRRTLLATASEDNTVRVWDYHRQSCQAVHQAAHPVAAVALHPWATDLIVAHREVAFTYVVAGSELVRGQRLPESAAGAPQPRSCM